MQNNARQYGCETLRRRLAGCLFFSFFIAMAIMPRAAHADEACGDNAVEISRVDHGNSVQVNCRCVKGFVLQGGSCVPEEAKAPQKKPTALCPSLEKQQQVAQFAASRASLAEDVYDLYSENKGLPTHWPAPAGYNLVTNNLQQLHQMFPGRTRVQIAHLLDPPGTDYRAAIYATADGGTLIVAFRGTSKVGDWTGADGPNYLGFKSWYFQRAAELALAVHQYAEAKHLKLEMVGHSLGGSLATYAGLKVGAKTTVFNSGNVRQPGLPKDAAQQAKTLVNDYITTRDPVSGLQVDHPALGNEIVLSDYPGAPHGFIAHHGIAFVRKDLAARLNNLSKALSSNSCGQ